MTKTKPRKLEEIKSSIKRKLPLVEYLVVPTRDFFDEVYEMAVTSYPEEYRKNDVDGLVRKLKQDVLKMAREQADETFDEIASKLKNEIRSYWRTENRLAR